MATNLDFKKVVRKALSLLLVLFGPLNSHIASGRPRLIMFFNGFFKDSAHHLIMAIVFVFNKI